MKGSDCIKSTEFIITVRATCLTVFPGGEALDHLDTLIELMTYEDEFAEETKVLGFLYDEGKDTLYLHKGVDIGYLTKMLPNSSIKYENFNKPKQMKFEYEEIIPPRNDEQVDVINFIAGLNQHSNNIDARQLFLIKAPGFGKAEPYSRKIPTPTPNGYTLMGDLNVGDYVFDANGNPTEILHIFEQGEQNVYEITFNDGRVARCTENHLWLVKDRCGHTKVLELKDMISTFKRKCSHSGPNRNPYVYNYRIPTCQPVEYPKADVPIDPWVLGCFIGNGCLREFSLTISARDDEIPRKIAEICGFHYRKNSDKNYSYTFLDKNDNVIHTKEFFKDLPCLVGEYSRDKFIPDKYIYNTTEVRLGVLQGLMDTDGSISEQETKYQVMFSTSSDRLAKQVQMILYTLGFSGLICNDNRSEKYTYEHYIIPFRVPNRFKHVLFRTERKHSTALRAKDVKQAGCYGHLLIKDIHKLPTKEKCRCIMVDNPDHLYLTENFIVTHNTFCSGVGLCKYGYKTLIIVHRDSLREQWMKSLYNMSGISQEYAHVISSTEEIVRIAHNEHDYDYDVYIMTHATFRAACKYFQSIDEIGNIVKNLGIGLKIIDEAHLEFRDTLMMDFCFNVKRNLYLTATGGRSTKEENSIFKHVFSNAVYYRPSSLLNPDMPKKWTEYITVCVNSNVNRNIYTYKVAGGRGMSPASYGKWVIQNDKKKTHLKCCKEILKIIYERDEKAKVLVFMPLIDLCSDAAYFFNKELNYDASFKYDLNIKTINSKNSQSENLHNRKADVIVTTIISCGTGTDIPGITDIISCSPFSSHITAEQVFGRIRYCGKTCHYYDIYDESVQLDKFWLRARRKKFKQLALNMRELFWKEDQ